MILQKLRGLYHSCMDEDLLDARGSEPLLHVIRTLRGIFTDESVNELRVLDADKDRKTLTAAVAYLHSRGMN